MHDTQTNTTGSSTLPGVYGCRDLTSLLLASAGGITRRPLWPSQNLKSYPPRWKRR